MNLGRRELLASLAIETPSRIVFLVLDGLGGAPGPDGRTELEVASAPNLDHLASRSLCGLTDPISPGITPGSGPSHLALFGYDPFEFEVGRGVLEAVGIDFPLQRSDVAMRANFCTVDGQGILLDRRAGRISSPRSADLCKLLQGIKLEGAELFVEPVKEHRFVVVFRGEGLTPQVAETDPQRTGVPPLEPLPLSPQASRTAGLASEFIRQAREILAGHEANMVMLRGFSCYPSLPSLEQLYKLRPAAIAVYPMYRGLARLVGMEVLATGSTLEEELETARAAWSTHDFFYIHVKDTDRTGEDGDFNGKVQAIEQVDRCLPALLDLKPEVLVVTGDHSTPAVMKAHSWHPVPFLMYSPLCVPDGLAEFSERSCRLGGLGRFPAVDAMGLALAYATKLNKYGA
ncbi:MAG: 2,3-bisphosphoglycerate-independent phosphoglycerate mutase [Dehalococcoidia bacterium]|nr:2,3-bisphosphoglycerate-independent phosphoglycerate mutase [Dehalococcoidia bacterium]